MIPRVLSGFRTERVDADLLGELEDALDGITELLPGDSEEEPWDMIAWRSRYGTRVVLWTSVEYRSVAERPELGLTPVPLSRLRRDMTDEDHEWLVPARTRRSRSPAERAAQWLAEWSGQMLTEHPGSDPDPDPEPEPEERRPEGEPPGAPPRLRVATPPRSEPEPEGTPEESPGADPSGAGGEAESGTEPGAAGEAGSAAEGAADSAPQSARQRVLGAFGLSGDVEDEFGVKIPLRSLDDGS